MYVYKEKQPFAILILFDYWFLCFLYYSYFSRHETTNTNRERLYFFPKKKRKQQIVGGGDPAVRFVSLFISRILGPRHFLILVWAELFEAHHATPPGQVCAAG